MTKRTDALYKEREKRVNDAIQLKVQDRVPVVTHFGFFPATYTGITCEEAMYDSEKRKYWGTRFVSEAMFRFQCCVRVRLTM
jgi:hypothetical protein